VLVGEAGEGERGNLVEFSAKDEDRLVLRRADIALLSWGCLIGRLRQWLRAAPVVMELPNVGVIRLRRVNGLFQLAGADVAVKIVIVFEQCRRKFVQKEDLRLLVERIV